MQNQSNWQISFNNELHQAQQARENGNEGMARVCARRAAGIVIGEYLRRLGIPDPGPSAYDRLGYIQSLPNLPSEVQEISKNLRIRVNEEFQLPADIDLIEEARRMAILLLNDNT